MLERIQGLHPQQELILLLTLPFLISALAKIIGLPSSLAHRQRMGVPNWLWRATGLAQLLGVFSLCFSLFEPRARLFAGTWLVLIMIGAAIAHWRVRDAWHHYITVSALLILSVLVILPA
ncbi:MAG: DoxX family protein [Caldilineaceae bacterium]